MKESLGMHFRCIIYKCYIFQHPDIFLFAKAVPDKSQWTIKAFIFAMLEKEVNLINVPYDGQNSCNIIIGK